VAQGPPKHDAREAQALIRVSVFVCNESVKKCRGGVDAQGAPIAVIADIARDRKSKGLATINIDNADRKKLGFGDPGDSYTLRAGAGPGSRISGSVVRLRFCSMTSGSGALFN
jgi:hypothetical protein